MEKKFQIPRMSLQLTIGSVMVVLLVALGVTIIYFTFESQKLATLKSTEKLFDYASAQTQEKLSALITPVETFVELSAQLDELDKGGELEFLHFMPYMFQSLQSTPWMSAVYLGYEDGDFFMLQSLQDNRVAKAAVSAPEEAFFFLKHVDLNTGESPSVTFTFYNRNMERLIHREVQYRGYDPRKRPWYEEAIHSRESIVTEPYIFFTTGQIGITAARTLAGGSGVFGADSTIENLLTGLEVNKLTPSTEIVVFNEQGNVLITTDSTPMTGKQSEMGRKSHLNVTLASMESSVMPALYKEHEEKGSEYNRVIRGETDDWFIHIAHMSGADRPDIYLAIASPFKELMVDARKMRKNNVFIVFFSVFMATLTALFISRKISTSLHGLSLRAEEIRNFQLDKPLSVESRITEVDRLAKSMAVMQSAINRFVEIARALSAEKEMEQVLEMILKEVTSVTEADGGAVGLISDDGKCLDYVLCKNSVTGIHRGGKSGKQVQIQSSLFDDLQTGPQSFEAHVVQSSKTLLVADLSEDRRFDYSAISEAQETGTYRCQSLLAIPLQNRQDEIIGILYLVNARDRKSNTIVNFDEHRVSYAEALSSNAALALDNNRLLRAQKELFDSFVRLLAGTIDTKSPYTGGHCQRVPVLTEMLAQAAVEDDGPLADFSMSDDERYELYVAAWLHDCGKVTTPEYVVDKATKLETIYNRIHEIRMRFEVLWRDAIIVYHQELADAPHKKKELQERLDESLKEFRQDFSFVAECNVGGEFMAPEHVMRIEEIGKKTWERFFDNRLGLSHEENQRMARSANHELPVQEYLFADKDEHIIPRFTDAENPLSEDKRFCMKVPENTYNLGELHNLCISRGTLTEEERFKINDHIVQTILMLNSLPFPKEIKRVPEWAGNHHEKLDGTGYPRCLTGKDLSVQERIMAIADIFEALTAADRPYKTPKPLSHCIEIMSFMRNDGHICSDLFDILLRSGVYKQYAEYYMQPGQIDEVDIESYLS